MNIEFDKRLELLYGLIYSVNRDMNNQLHPGLFVEELPNYNNEFYKLYKENASDELIEYIKNNGINGNWNQPCYIALSLDENYNIIGNDLLNKEVIKENVNFDKEKVERLIKEFVLKSNYEEFFNSHKSLYDVIIKSYIESMSKYNVFDENFIINFYGYKKGDMSIKLYNFTSGSMGILINNTQYYIQRVDNIGKDEENFVFKPKLFTMIHEFSHPYINPLLEKYFIDIDCYNLYEEILENDINSNIKNNYILLNRENAYEILKEYLVRAVTIYLAGKYESIETIEKAKRNQYECGFIHIEEIIKLFNRKDEYNNFEDFFKKEIVNYFLNIKSNVKKVDNIV